MASGKPEPSVIRTMNIAAGIIKSSPLDVTRLRSGQNVSNELNTKRLVDLFASWRYCLSPFFSYLTPVAASLQHYAKLPDSILGIEMYTAANIRLVSKVNASSTESIFISRVLSIGLSSLIAKMYSLMRHEETLHRGSAAESFIVPLPSFLWAIGFIVYVESLEFGIAH
ncbi:hypothetical protein FG05_13168 [Fusarium graminearum]|nr:hypothetical protein FG05_13168 [Fusarium graminearum]